MRRGGYKPQKNTGGSSAFFGVKNRWSILGTYLFHGAFFLVAVGFLLTMATRYKGRVLVAVGETFTGKTAPFLSQSASGLFALGRPNTSFKVERIDTAFWRNSLLFTRLEADVRILPGRRERRIRMNSPLWVGPATFIRLAGIGYAPRYELLNRNGTVLESAFVKLNVFPPGEEDFIQSVKYPFRIYVSVYPDAVIVKGKIHNKSLNLVHPALAVRVTRGKLELGRKILRLGEDMRFEGLRLRFPEIRYWGEFTLLRDWGIPWLFMGYLLGMVGLLIRVQGKRAEIQWLPGKENRGGVIRGWGGSPLGQPSSGTTMGGKR